MKRHPALAELSRDHHHVLVLARRARKAQLASVPEEARCLLEHWDAQERAHFRLEEEILLPAYAMHGSVEHPAIAQMLLEHVLIRRDVARLAERASLERLHDLGVRLEAHVRLEERKLFPLIEEALSEDALAALGDRLRTGATGASSKAVSSPP